MGCQGGVEQWCSGMQEGILLPVSGRSEWLLSILVEHVRSLPNEFPTWLASEYTDCKHALRSSLAHTHSHTEKCQARTHAHSSPGTHAIALLTVKSNVSSWSISSSHTVYFSLILEYGLLSAINRGMNHSFLEVYITAVMTTVILYEMNVYMLCYVLSAFPMIHENTLCFPTHKGKWTPLNYCFGELLLILIIVLVISVFQQPLLALLVFSISSSFSQHFPH